MSFRDGYVGMLSKVKYMVADIEKDKFINNLAFEASNDNTTYTELFRTDYNIGSGWNYHEFDSKAQPKYKYYRFVGNNSNACMLNEV